MTPEVVFSPSGKSWTGEPGGGGPVRMVSVSDSILRMSQLLMVSEIAGLIINGLLFIPLILRTVKYFQKDAYN